MDVRQPNLLPEARDTIVGSLLLGAPVGQVMQRVHPDDMGHGNVRSLYDAARRLWMSGKPIDPVTLQVEAGADYSNDLLRILQLTPTAANWEAYADIVHQQALLERMQAEALMVCTAMEISDAKEHTEKLSQMLADRPDLRIVSFTQGLCEFMERQMSKAKPDYLKFGLKPLDDILTAEQGDFIILGARPSVGKTAIASQFAYNMAITGKHVGIFSLETKDRKLYDRLIPYLARIPFDSVKHRTMTDTDFEKVVDLGKVSGKVKLEIIDAAGMSVDDIQAVTLSRHYDVVYVDYLQLLSAKGKDRYEKVTNISLALHTMAARLGVTVVGLAQLSRPDRDRKNKPPSMSDLRESGQLEQDADVIMLLYLDDEDMTEGDRVLKIDKNKDGPRGIVRLGFYSKYISFYPKGGRPLDREKFKPVTGEDAQCELPF